MVLQDHRHSEELLEALDTLDRWPEKVRLMQRNWIGRSKGCASPLRWSKDKVRHQLEVFTTRPDTLFGASFMAISPIIRCRKALAAGNPAIAASSPNAAATARRRPRSSPPRRWASTRACARSIRSIDGHTTLPVYIANFVLMDYGTGAIFGCPAHDQRDLDFATNTAAGACRSCCPAGDDPRLPSEPRPMSATALMINSRFLDGLASRGEEGRIAALARKGDGNRPARRSPIACATGASRASATGAARSRSSIAICGVVPVPEKDLPVKLPDGRDFDRAGQPARPPSDLEARRLPDLRRPARARPTRWTRSSTRPGTSPASPIRGRRRRRPEAVPTTGCRSTSISAASSTRSCTCSIRASSPAP
jgi:leucyl-tRNA synthetase